MEIYEQEMGSEESIPQSGEILKKELSENQKSIITRRWNDMSKTPPSIDELLLLTEFLF